MNQSLSSFLRTKLLAEQLRPSDFMFFASRSLCHQSAAGKRVPVVPFATEIPLADIFCCAFQHDVSWMISAVIKSTSLV